MRFVPAAGLLALSFCFLEANGDQIQESSIRGKAGILETARGRQRKLPALYNHKKPKKYYPLGECEGDCDNDEQCDGELKCFSEKGTKNVPGCSGERVDGLDYCYMPNDVAAEGDVPAGTDDSNELFIKGRNNRDGPLARCGGDCNSDDDCEGDLICFMRKGDEPVPGCSGQARSDKDYCIAPFGERLPLEWCGEEPPNKLGPCQGDCDRDSDCLPGLQCFKRRTDDTTAVPGCDGVGFPGSDYCIGALSPPTPYPRCPTTPAPTPSPTPPRPPDTRTRRPTVRRPSRCPPGQNRKPHPPMRRDRPRGPNAPWRKPCETCYSRLEQSGINRHWLHKIFHYFRYMCESCRTSQCIHYKYRVLENMRHQASGHLLNRQNRAWYWCNNQARKYKLRRTNWRE